VLDRLREFDQHLDRVVEFQPGRVGELDSFSTVSSIRLISIASSGR
jgi:hypothetical protein